MMSPHPMLRRTLAALAFVASSGLAYAQFNARVQAIHNAPDPSLEVIDFYVAGQLVLDDVEFRTASPYLDIPALIPLTGGIAPGNSTGPEDVFFEFTFTLALNQTYQFILVGVRDPDQFLPNPDGRDISLDVLVNEDAREVGSHPDSVDVNVVHGAPDVSALDVGVTLIITALDRVGEVPLADGIQYSDRSEYVTIEPMNVVAVEGTDGNPASVWYVAEDLYTFEEAITILMSGFLDPGQNQNGALFAPMIVLADGSTTVLEPVPVAIEGVAFPRTFALHGNYPNPFNPSTTISFDLSSPAGVSIEVFDVFGRNILTTPRASFSAGAGHEIQLDASSLPSGTYLYRVLAEMSGGMQVQTGRMTLVK